VASFASRSQFPAPDGRRADGPEPSPPLANHNRFGGKHLLVGESVSTPFGPRVPARSIDQSPCDGGFILGSHSLVRRSTTRSSCDFSCVDAVRCSVLDDEEQCRGTRAAHTLVSGSGPWVSNWS
jgi:hypothetical protein